MRSIASSEISRNSVKISSTSASLSLITIPPGESVINRRSQRPGGGGGNVRQIYAPGRVVHDGQTFFAVSVNENVPASDLYEIDFFHRSPQRAIISARYSAHSS